MPRKKAVANNDMVAVQAGDMKDIPPEGTTSSGSSSSGSSSSNRYDERQMIPADNVDAVGVAWATVGENIRKGANGVSTDTTFVEKLIESLTGISVKVTTIHYDRTNADGARCTVDAEELKSTIRIATSNQGGSRPVTSIIYFDNVDYLVSILPYNWTNSKYNAKNFGVQELFPYFVAYGNTNSRNPYLQMADITTDDQFSVDLVIAYHVKE